MALKIIGSGAGRTGTLSLKKALTTLGFGPCHHMAEVFPRPDSIPLWMAAAAGRPDWEAIFEGFNSAVDYPAAMYWRELADYYPEAKIIHTVRDPDEWFDSTQGSIFAPGSPAVRGETPMAPFFQTLVGRFEGKLHDRGHMTAYFRDLTKAVTETIPAERLLVYRTGEGWEPLCAFLGVPVPDEAYPNVNSRAEFKARLISDHADPAPN